MSCSFSSETVIFQKVFSADKIDDHVWLGDIDSSENHEALDNLNITHILTVLHFDPERAKDDRRIRKHVYAYDMHTADLIGEFESCYQFIDQAVRKNQNVLIHCHAGIRKKCFCFKINSFYRYVSECNDCLCIFNEEV
jgi:protein-tyrosine phosphatase